MFYLKARPQAHKLKLTWQNLGGCVILSMAPDADAIVIKYEDDIYMYMFCVLAKECVFA